MPASYVLLQFGLNAIWCLLVFCYGACIGSLINVIVYRMPLGLSIVSPPSRCPKCQTKLAWNDNIPVLGWIFLRGKCRYCKTPISPEYPVVEAVVGSLFVLFFVLWYLAPTFDATYLGINWASVRPVWYLNPAWKTWPSFVVLLILVSSLVAMTLVDARTFTIPPPLTTFPAVAAFLIHPIHAAVVGVLRYRTGAVPGSSSGWLWVMATPDRLRWDWILAGILGMVGLGIGWLLLKFRLIRRSFEDYAEWEESLKTQQAPTAVPEITSSAAGVALPSPESTAELLPGEQHDAASQAPADVWIMYPHARREMFKEMAFIAPCGVLMLIGWYLGHALAGLTFRPDQGTWAVTATSPLGFGAPLWLTVLGGVCLGYLIGGGIVWIVRILGSLAFGKEAMGLGDAHLMAAVGACLGTIDAGLAFFGAAFVGLFWIVLSLAFSRSIRRTMPYGPYLAVSTLLVVLFKPLIKLGLSRLYHAPIDFP